MDVRSRNVMITLGSAKTRTCARRGVRVELQLATLPKTNTARPKPLVRGLGFRGCVDDVRTSQEHQTVGSAAGTYHRFKSNSKFKVTFPLCELKNQRRIWAPQATLIPSLSLRNRGES